MTFAGIILRLVQSYKYSFFLEHTYIRPSHQFGQLKQTCCWSTSVKKALLSQKKMGHLHDDISVLVPAESYKGLLSCANQGFCYASVNFSCTQPPPPPSSNLPALSVPGWGICKFCAARGPGICQPQGQTQAFDTHAVSYQNITTLRILLGKHADWLICRGQEKIEEVCKGMFSMLCMHFFIAY